MKRRAPHKLAEVAPLREVEAPPTGRSLLADTLARLEAGDLLGDPAGTAALILAERIDARAESGASMAALAKQHAASLAEAMSRAAVADDPLDELKRRRDEKLGLA